ncbi:calcium/sodium antiporter [Streptomyces alkaliphilus]|uniref:Calcium/sodium antiporter n=1 Tax=Streptomyces alkaliphilus TaxID=1472722 RepID=A0A7W3TFJ6_9ACTN|nr:calcium/sodium antiporter [Streptomyces alkaliphilus]MBB0245913.1 calcium/sodium antiporter [Streptomyces alkaliphilus]
MDLLDVGRIIVGLVLLTVGGEVLVRGASSLAARVGISSLVVGLTVVSTATSTPELAVTVGAVMRDEPGLAVGNVVGSNIANVLLILGISALVLPLLVKQRLVRLDLPIMVLLSVMLLVMSLDGGIGLVDGIILLAVLIGYTVMTVLVSRREAVAERAADRPGGDGTAGPGTGAGTREGDPGGTAGVGPEPAAASEEMPSVSVPKSLLLVVIGVALLVAGATVLVEGAVNTATAFGVSSLVVGLTVVAVGTSLPELAVSVIAVRRGERDLAVGNVVGSNIANIGLVLGLPAILSADGLPVPDAAVALDIPLMLAAAVALLPIAFTGFVVARWEGGLFLALYAAYTAFVVLAATQHDALEGFTTVMAWFVLPLVAVTLIAVTAHEIGLHRGRREKTG